MLQVIDSDQLIKGEIYCVIHNFLERKENLVFDGNSFFKYPDSNYSFQLHLRMNTFYRYVSKEEIYAKVKQKYDAKCLNIILKRLIDESFQSDFL
jgi:hypothetical protein